MTNIAPRNKNVAYASKSTSGEETNFPIRPPGTVLEHKRDDAESRKKKKCAAGKTHRRNLGAHCAKNATPRRKK